MPSVRSLQNGLANSVIAVAFNLLSSTPITDMAIMSSKSYRALWSSTKASRSRVEAAVGVMMRTGCMHEPTRLG